MCVFGVCVFGLCIWFVSHTHTRVVCCADVFFVQALPPPFSADGDCRHTVSVCVQRQTADTLPIPEGDSSYANPVAVSCRRPRERLPGILRLASPGVD